jgi:hypothetical protein
MLIEMEEEARNKEQSAFEVEEQAAEKNAQ